MRNLISHISIRICMLSLFSFIGSLILSIFTNDSKYYIFIVVISAVILYLLEIKGVVTYHAPNDKEEE